MKKIVVLLLTLVLVLPLVAFADGTGTYEIALVTDVGNIDDQSFNQFTWEGVKQFAEENGKTYNYYQPSEDSTGARVETMKAAIDKGAKVIVCPGYLFEDAIYEMQGDYPQVQFLLIDGEPHSEDYSDYKTEANTTNILYREEQPGYLAGYAAVKDGYTKLGFLGGMAVPAVIRYGYGFVQGANAAAEELAIDVSIKYWYCGSFAPNDDIKNKMTGWYTDGTEVVFACGGGIFLSATAAAEAAGTKVIGVDVDQRGFSETVITSAMKELAGSTMEALTQLYANDMQWPEALSGKTRTLGAAEGMVGLPTAEESWKFNTFTLEEYNDVLAKIVSGDIVVSNETANAPTVGARVTVDYQE